MFASVTGSSILATPLVPAQASAGPLVYPQTLAESAAGAMPTNYNYAAGNVLRYGTNTTPGTTDMSTAFQAAFNQQAKGGAAIYAPTGAYLIASVISTSSAAPFTLYGDGMGKTVITKRGDGDCFVVTNSSASHDQIMISDLTISPGVAMSTGSALNLTCTGIIPSVTLHNVMILCGGTGVFGHGIKLNNCGEVEMSRVFIYGIGSTSMIGVSVTQSVAATVYKFIGCSIYNVAYGVIFKVTTRPGIEGVQFYGCDIVNVQCGVLFTNSFGTGYFPPELTWIGGHINASVRSFDLSIMTQILIEGLLSYNSGNSQHIRLFNVSDVNIQGNTFVQVGGTADGIAMAASGTVYGGIIAKNLFHMSASGNAVNLNANNMKNLTISDNQRVLGSATVNISAGILDGTVLILNNTPRDTIDIFDTTLTGAASMTLAGIRSDYCRIGAPGNATTCTVLTSRRAWDRVILECSSNLLTLQHNAANPDGFFLAGGVNYTFPATGGRVTLEKRNGGYWTEVARNG
jgi:Pectate lyase superfamily protein